jgi:hypothetical protein
VMAKTLDVELTASRPASNSAEEDPE